MMAPKQAAFIDANVLIEAAAYQAEDIFAWLTEVYEDIYIHQQVLEELQLPSVRRRVEAYIHEGTWTRFDPEEEETLSDDAYVIYDSYVADMRQAFTHLDHKKVAEGRRLKHTNDLGEIHCLAAALVLQVGIICSNDYDIGEVIADESLTITMNDEEVTISQDTLVEVCYHVIHHSISTTSKTRKFLKTVKSSNVHDLDALLESRG